MTDGPLPEVDPAEQEPVAPGGPTREELARFEPVWAGSRQDAEKLAAILSREGLPAAVGEEPREVEDEAEPAWRILVPPEAVPSAIWFFKGFEWAATLFADPPEGKPSA
jgi:hypothetical protein